MQISMMVEYVREMTVKESWKYGKYGSFEHLLFLYVFLISSWEILCFLFRFVPDKEFEGTDRNRRREGPVQFTRDVEEDLFGLDKFFKDAKKGQKRTAEESSSRRDYDSGKSGSKKRREWS